MPNCARSHWVRQSNRTKFRWVQRREGERERKKEKSFFLYFQLICIYKWCVPIHRQTSLTKHSGVHKFIIILSHLILLPIFDDCGCGTINVRAKQHNWPNKIRKERNKIQSKQAANCLPERQRREGERENKTEFVYFCPISVKNKKNGVHRWRRRRAVWCAPQ